MGLKEPYGSSNATIANFIEVPFFCLEEFFFWPGPGYLSHKYGDFSTSMRVFNSFLLKCAQFGVSTHQLIAILWLKCFSKVP